MRHLTKAGLAAIAVASAAGLALASSPHAAARPAGPHLVQVSTDRFHDPASYHATEVEPDTFSHGSTIVSAFQVGRVYDGGSADNGFATSTDAGKTWRNGVLPDTVYSGGPYARISDPAVGYDARHRTWLVSGLAVNDLAVGEAVTINRSRDGLHWSRPVEVYHIVPGGFVDKEWVVCDNHASSPHYGTCYAEFDLPSQGDLLQMSTSTDGGRTWSAPKPTADNAVGLGGQPLVQPDGTVVVPYLGFTSSTLFIGSFRSTDGGASWSAHTVVSPADYHPDGGTLRNDPLPTAEIDHAGRIYVVWNDCRFRTGCTANDIVLSTTTDGLTWTSPVRVPIDPVTSSVDHMLPGIDIADDTAGSTARIGLYYYEYPQTLCDIETCRLDVGYVSSTDGGATWSRPTHVAGPMTLGEIAPTSGGLMVGDYLSVSVVGKRAVSVFAVGKRRSGGGFDLAMYGPRGGLPVTGGSTPVTRSPAVSQHNAPKMAPDVTLRVRTAY